MKIPKVQSGWAMEREPFSILAREVFEVTVDDRRNRITLPSDAMRGCRFNDDAAILARLESIFSEREFMECPGPSIDKALCDAAKSDWWYTHEKCYEDYYSDESTDEDNDDGE